MKKTIAILFLFSLISNTCYSQSGWFWLNPLPQGNNLNDIQNVGQNIVYCCGNNGSMIKSTNLGLNWVLQSTNVTGNLNAIHFVNAFTGYAVGDIGIILKTTNGGFNWSNISYSSNKFYDVYAINSDLVFVSGLNILRSTNGGLNWLQVNNQPSHKIQFTDNLNGYAIGIGSQTYSGKLFKTTNGGINWQLISESTNTSFKSIYYLNNNTGFISTYYWSYPNFYIGRILRTTDGSYSFSTIYSESSKIIDAISFSDGMNGCAIRSVQFTNYTKLMRTSNGGTSWDTNCYPSAQPISSVDYKGSLIFGCGVGGYINRSSDVGSSWYDCSKGFYDQINDISFLNLYTGFVASETGKIFSTTNSGLNWNSYQLSNSVYSIGMINNVGFAGTNNSIMKTSNYGLNWQQVYFQNSSYISSLFFFNKDTGFAGGIYGLLLKTTNSGMNWVNKGNANNSHYYGLFFINRMTGWVCGWNGYLLKTTNGGENWTQLIGSATGDKYDIYFTSPDTGYMAAQRSILKTINGGLNWVTVYYVEQSSFKSIIFTSKLKGFASGFDGTLMITTNAGVNWWNSNWITNNMANSIFAIDSNILITGGINGSVLCTTNGGMPIAMQSQYTKISSFSLFQNYPNPFNPVTKIKYEIPLSRGVSEGRGVSVQLIIYDVLGREIETLVNQTQKPGSYEVQWDGSRYASGVYFYKLMTEDPSTGSGQGYVETRKMVLIK